MLFYAVLFALFNYFVYDPTAALAAGRAHPGAVHGSATTGL